MSSLVQLLFVLALIAYSIPAALSAYFNLKNLRSIVLVNFFAFTGIGWIIAFIMFLYGMRTYAKTVKETPPTV